MNILDGVSWGLIPARGGSKSIRLKNLVPFAGRPLLDYQVLAARGSGRIERLICSTDSVKIAEHCVTLDIEVHDRPRELSGDNVPVLSVITHLLNDIDAREGGVAELIALLQPTSPFLLPSHIAECVDALLTHPEAASAQTVIPCPHAHHAVNQRVIEGGAVAFRYPDKRARASLGTLAATSAWDTACATAGATADVSACRMTLDQSSTPRASSASRSARRAPIGRARSKKRRSVLARGGRIDRGVESHA